MTAKQTRSVKACKGQKSARTTRRQRPSTSFYEYLRTLIAQHPEWAEQDEKELDAVSAYALKLMRTIETGFSPPNSLYELFGLEYDNWHDGVLEPAEKLYYQYVDAQLDANPHIFKNFRKSLERSAREMNRSPKARPS